MIDVQKEIEMNLKHADSTILSISLCRPFDLFAYHARVYIFQKKAKEKCEEIKSGNRCMQKDSSK